MIIDAATSRLKVNNEYCEAAKDLIVDIGVSKFAVAVVVGPRLDLLDSLRKRCTAVFKQCKVAVIQLVGGGGMQRRGVSKPSFAIIIHSDPDMPFPYFKELLKFRAAAREEIRLRCMSKACPFRNDDERASLQRPLDL